MIKRRQSKAHRVAEPKAVYLGDIVEQLGKTEARQRFFPLVEDLQENTRAIEITDRGCRVAVLLSYRHYQTLVSKARAAQPPGPLIDLRGSVEIIGDLEAGRREINDAFKRSVNRRTEELL